MSVLSVVPPCVRIMYWNPANIRLEEDEKKINDINVQLEMFLFVHVLPDLRLICVMYREMLRNSKFRFYAFEIGDSANWLIKAGFCRENCQSWNDEIKQEHIVYSSSLKNI